MALSVIFKWQLCYNLVQILHIAPLSLGHNQSDALNWVTILPVPLDMMNVGQLYYIYELFSLGRCIRR